MSYRILSVEGSGTFGTVVKARDLNDNRRIVALKVLKEDHLDNDVVLERTRDEARMLVLLQHDNIVDVLGLRVHKGRPLMVMEWLEGISLGDLVDAQEGGLPIADAIEIIRLCCAALDYAYNRLTGNPLRPMGVVHRDLKPNNLFLTIGGVPKIVDFGLAKGQFEGRESVTMSMVLGTRAYMAPERLDGAEDSPKGDVYGLGLILYELLHGRATSLSLNPKYHQARLDELLAALDPPGLDPTAKLRLAAIIGRMCAYETEDRLSHAQAAKALGALLRVSELEPDLLGMARRLVKPIYTARRPVDPKTHRQFKDIAFLEEPDDRRRTRTPTSAPTASDSRRANEIDGQLRHMLADEQWESRLPALRRLLVRSPEWTADPFLEVLDADLSAAWQLPPSPQKMAVCLEFLKQRMSPEVVKRASALSAHDDSLVAGTARAVVAMGQHPLT